MFDFDVRAAITTSLVFNSSFFNFFGVETRFCEERLNFDVAQLLKGGRRILEIGISSHEFVVVMLFADDDGLKKLKGFHDFENEID